MQAQTKDFSVLTYNIRFGHDLHGQLNLERTGELIKQSQAQLIGLQEVDCHHEGRSQNIDQAQKLGQYLEMEYCYAPAIDRDFKFGNLVLSDFPMQQTKKLILPKKGTREDRSVAIAEVCIGNQDLTFLSTHLGLDQDERLEHIKYILDYIQTLATPVILVGDWNEQPGSPAYNEITKILKDAACEVNKNEATFSYLAPSPNMANVRIDFIFVSPEIKVLDVETIEVWASDHLPVKAKLRLSSKGG